jgi:hypothetical protein
MQCDPFRGVIFYFVYWPLIRRFTEPVRPIHSIVFKYWNYSIVLATELLGSLHSTVPVIDLLIWYISPWKMLFCNFVSSRIQSKTLRAQFLRKDWRLWVSSSRSLARATLCQCSANFFHPRHTLIYQRHMTAHHKILPHEKGYETIHGHKYVSN